GSVIPMRNGQNRAEDPAVLLFRAKVLNQIGRPQSALLDIDRLSNKTLTPAQLTKLEVVRAAAFVALGEMAAASGAVRSGYELMNRFKTVNYKAALDRIAQTL